MALKESLGLALKEIFVKNGLRPAIFVEFIVDIALDLALETHPVQCRNSPKDECVVRNSREEKHLDKYDLSKKAYVLVLHHHKFDDSTHNRAGSEKDMEKIERFFRAYRVDPLNVCANETAEEVRYIMDNIAHKDFSDNSCLIIIIMSHGLANDQIMARDGKTYCFEGDIVEKCTSNRTLDGKPKLFIVQACRGGSVWATDSINIQSNKNDVLIFQSTYKGFVALRNPQEGTFFMQHFFRLLDEHRDKDIFGIIKLLNGFFESSALPQNPTMTTTLRKDLIFDDLRL
ncbi:caspase-7-like [Anopheles aquasalis]|uniref:caspase-7-like n=1 Tax=Anopheles aquasalis TaxID=42839 RepID=UPI00215A6C69|nr:caspase-7-like [Anopheles aquasalis]